MSVNHTPFPSAGPAPSQDLTARGVLDLSADETILAAEKFPWQSAFHGYVVTLMERVGETVL